jgi:hypothetical protein
MTKQKKIVLYTKLLPVKGFKKLVNPMKIVENPVSDDKLNNSTFVGYLGSLKKKTQLVRLRLLLVRLLLRSQLYSPDILLKALTEAGPLNIEKAIVFGRVSTYKEDFIHMVGRLTRVRL